MTIHGCVVVIETTSFWKYLSLTILLLGKPFLASKIASFSTSIWCCNASIFSKIMSRFTSITCRWLDLKSSYNSSVVTWFCWFIREFNGSLKNISWWWFFNEVVYCYVCDPQMFGVVSVSNPLEVLPKLLVMMGWRCCIKLILNCIKHIKFSLHLKAIHVVFQKSIFNSHIC